MLDFQITVNGNIPLKTAKKFETHPGVRNLTKTSNTSNQFEIPFMA